MQKLSHLSIPKQQMIGKKLIPSLSSPDQQIFSSNFSLFSFTSDMREKNFTENLKTLHIGSFLAYRLTTDSTSSIFKSFSNEKGSETTRIDSESSNLEISFNKGHLLVDLSSLQQNQPLAGFEMTCQNIIFLMQNQVFLTSQSEILNHFNLQRFYADLESALNLFFHEEEFLIEVFKVQLDKLNKPWTEGPKGGVLYEDLCDKGQKVEVEVWVKQNLINIEIFTGKNEGKLPDSVQKYLKNINQKEASGKFGLSQNFFFTTSFNAFENTQDNLSIFQIIRPLIKNLLFHYRNISNLSQTKELQNTLAKLGLAQVTKSLTSEELEKEKMIKNLLDQAKDVYFNNRFLNRRITFLPAFSVVYYKRLNFTTFLEFSEEQPAEALKSIFNLIEKLSEIGLKFQNNNFPLKDFAWYEEKPIFLYDKPLCSVLEVFERSGESFAVSHSQKLDSILKTKENFFNSLIVLHNDLQNSDLPVIPFKDCEIFFESSEFIQINEDFTENTARARLVLYNSNSFPFVRENRAIAQVGHEKFLLCAPRFESRLEEKLLQVFEEKNEGFALLTEVLKQLIDFVDAFTRKNTNFSCFDPDSLGFMTDDRLMIELWACEEVRKEFIPPEVASGRHHRFSIVFCLGKVILHLFSLVFHMIHEEETESFGDIQHVSVFQEFQGLEELVAGCTQRIVSKRWTLSKIKEKILEICDNFPII